MTLLAIDAGNTRIKWGVRREDGWSERGDIATAEVSRLELPQAERAIASNVAGTQVRASLAGACPGIRFIESRESLLGVTNRYEDPGQLGTDRFAALIAAHHAGHGHKLVVNAGTALTVDALSAAGEFVGGIIVPGPALMRRSLDRGTAGLRLTEGKFAHFPRSTPDAITSGALQAAVGAIVRMAEAMGAKGMTPGAIILSGGAAPELAPHLPLDATIHENLVLDGLVLIAGAP